MTRIELFVGQNAPAALNTAADLATRDVQIGGAQLVEDSPIGAAWRYDLGVEDRWHATLQTPLANVGIALEGGQIAVYVPALLAGAFLRVLPTPASNGGAEKDGRRMRRFAYGFGPDAPAFTLGDVVALRVEPPTASS